MFNVERHKTIIRDIHKIVSNRYVFFTDGDNDILYSGTNIYGNRILAAIIYDDEENDHLRYLHILIDDSQFFKFINRELSLISILQINESFFIVDLNYDGSEKFVNLISFDELPEEFRPLENSFCPEFTIDPTFEYCVSLKGKSSDLHKAKPDDLNEVNTKFTNFIEASLEFIDKFDYERSLYIEAPIAGSFQLNFIINLETRDQFRLYNVPKRQLNGFINHLYNYILYQLPTEEDDVLISEEGLSERFNSIKSELESIYESAQLSYDAEDQQNLVKSINRSIMNLKDIDYEGSFDHIEFANISETGEKIPIGLLNRDYIPSVRNKLYMLIEEEEVITVDNNPINYQIRVYQFNTQTGNGSAYVKYDEDKLDKVSIHVHGRTNYENTDFTHSMDNGTIVTILGIGKKISGKLKEINFDLPE